MYKQVNYGEEVNVNLSSDLILPEGTSYKINNIEGSNISVNNNGFVYKPKEDEFNE